MKPSRASRFVFLAFLAGVALQRPAAGESFEGHIAATLTRGSDTQNILYTVSTNALRIERTEIDRPYPKNLLDRAAGAVTMVYPHNRSFIRLNSSPKESSPPPGFPSMPPGTGARMSSMPPVIGPSPAMSGMQSMPMAMGGMPMMPMMPGEKAELQITTNTMTILGYDCVRYDFKQRGEVMEIWATDKLLPFQPWLQNERPRFGPRMIEERWGELLKAKKLFPLLAVLKFENGPERLRFEVTSVKSQRIQDLTLFEPPLDYNELEPLPF